MRIAMLSWESLHSIAVGGIAAHVSELAAALCREGHEVHVFTRRGPGQPYFSRIDGVHYHRCAYLPHPDFVDDVNNMCRSFVDRVFEVEDLFGPFDVVHAHDWLAGNAMIWVKQGRSRRGIFTIHSTEYGRCGNAFYSGQCERIRIQEQAGTYWADRIIAVSNALSREVQWMYSVPEAKISVVYNGVNPRPFENECDLESARRQYAIDPLAPVVIFCGRLTLQKGPDLLVEAIPAVLGRQAGTTFVFAGDGDMRGALEERTRQLSINHAVRYLGRRNGEDLVRLFRLANVVCVPSRNEPFGIVVLEAWSASKPVVVTENGGPNEYVQHEVNGLKIYPTADSVAWGLGTLLAEPDRARWMGSNGRRTVQAQFSWEEIARQTLRVYDPDAGGRLEVAHEPAWGPVSQARGAWPWLTARGNSPAASHGPKGLESCVCRSTPTSPT